MIFQTIHFIEPFICEKAEFFVFIYIYVHRYNLLCYHSLNPCLTYSDAESFCKSFNGEAHDHYVKVGRVGGGGDPYKQHVLLKTITIFLKFKFLKKLRYSVIFSYDSLSLRTYIDA